MKRASLMCALVLLGACGSSIQKPRELETLEQMREQPEAKAAESVAPELMQEVDSLKGKSWGSWKSEKLDDSIRDALMATIKLKMAIGLVVETRAKERIAAADQELGVSETEYAKLAKELATVNEQIALLDKLAAAKGTAEQERLKAEQERQKLSQQLTLEQQKSSAQAKIADAELALKTADTVDASVHAKAEYATAADLVKRAQIEYQSANYAGAETTAELARQKAEVAEKTARPKYSEAEQTKANKQRDEALSKEAAGLSGITVKLERQGEVTRLALTMANAFKPKKTTLNPGQDPVLDSIAALLKKYPTYPVQIIGHTDNKGKRDALIVISHARAQTVFDALVARGVDGKRFVVSGKGPDQPSADNKSAAGRKQNNRVEIVFLYQ